jgi:ankyrin repeat protein
MKIHSCCYTGNLSELEDLLALGIHNINEIDNYGHTPLQYAAESGCLEIVKLLLKHGASINDGGRGTGTALHYASRNNHLEIVRELIKQGADVNDRDIFGRTPLHLTNYPNIILELINHHTDINTHPL